MVNRAWLNPNDPASAMPILLFNQGSRLNPDPPVLTGVHPGQQVPGFSRRQRPDDVAGENHEKWAQKGQGAGIVYGDDEQATYTETWTELIETFGAQPEGPAPASGGDLLPGFEELLKAYYLDQSPEALEEMRTVLLEKFPGLGLEKVFEENPFGVKEAIEKLIGMSQSDVAIRNTLQDISIFGGGGLNLWPTMKAVSSAGATIFITGRSSIPSRRYGST